MLEPRLGQVFPAYAGMFPWAAAIFRHSSGFPRIRGDVPPPTRRLGATHRVFPAYAGMFPQLTPYGTTVICFPRIRGDVPFYAHTPGAHPLFSPHTRGCSYEPEGPTVHIEVFPAYAGMFPVVRHGGWHRTRFPRIRGDVPAAEVASNARALFSPHTRGCSVWRLGILAMFPVFPAYAGMFRLRCRTVHPWLSFPRIRGDVPTPRGLVFTTLGFSPHTRGCSPLW